MCQSSFSQQQKRRNVQKRRVQKIREVKNQRDSERELLERVQDICSTSSEDFARNVMEILSLRLSR